jgi:hypothetical protein
VDPLIGFALTHAEQAPLHHLERIGLQVGEDEEQSIFWGRERTVLVHREPTGGAQFPIEAPHCKMRLERRLKGRDEELKLVERQAGEIEELCGASLHIGESGTGHLWCLLSWEAEYTIIGINSITDKLKSDGAAKHEILPGVEHRQSRYLTNRCENSQRPTRQREHRMQGFKAAGHAQRFLAAYGPIAPHFRPRRHLLSAPDYR